MDSVCIIYTSFYFALLVLLNRISSFGRLVYIFEKENVSALLPESLLIWNVASQLYDNLKRYKILELQNIYFKMKMMCSYPLVSAERWVWKTSVGLMVWPYFKIYMASSGIFSYHFFRSCHVTHYLNNSWKGHFRVSNQREWLMFLCSFLPPQAMFLPIRRRGQCAWS